MKRSSLIVLILLVTASANAFVIRPGNYFHYDDKALYQCFNLDRAVDTSGKGKFNAVVRLTKEKQFGYFTLENGNLSFYSDKTVFSTLQKVSIFENPAETILRGKRGPTKENYVLLHASKCQ